MASLGYNDPDSKVNGTNIGPTSVLSVPGEPHVGPMNLAIRGVSDKETTLGLTSMSNPCRSEDLCYLGDQCRMELLTHAANMCSLVVHQCPQIHPNNTMDPNSKVRGAHVGFIWGRQDPGGPHVGPMNVVISRWGIKTPNCGANAQFMSMERPIKEWNMESPRTDHISRTTDVRKRYEFNHMWSHSTRMFVRVIPRQLIVDLIWWMLRNSLHRRAMSKDCRFATGMMACSKSQMVRFVLTIIDYDGLNIYLAI